MELWSHLAGVGLSLTRWQDSGALPLRAAGLRGKSTGHLNEARRALDISERAEPSGFVALSLPLPVDLSGAPGKESPTSAGTPPLTWSATLCTWLLLSLPSPDWETSS